MKIKKKILIENQKKIIFTAGPASLSAENLSELKPCFGRGDDEYLKVENYVLKKLHYPKDIEKIPSYLLHF